MPSHTRIFDTSLDLFKVSALALGMTFNVAVTAYKDRQTAVREIQSALRNPLIDDKLLVQSP
jgi:hypothetical protein